MKLSIYTIITFFFLLSSCQGPEKMVQKGKYDTVLERANTVFKRNRAPSSDWITATEQSLSLANSRDLKTIEYLQQQGDLSDWKKVYVTAVEISDRQKNLNALFSSTGSDEHKPNFDFTDIQPKIDEAKSRLAAMYFEQAQKEMESVRQGSKKAALASIRLVDSAFHWGSDIYLVEELRQEAVDSAQINLAIYINDEDTDYFKNYLAETLAQEYVPYLNINMYPNSDFDSDYSLFLDDFSMSIGAGRESSTKTNFSKEVVTGHKVTQEWSNTDSTWVTKTKEIRGIVYGTLKKYRQNKHGSIRVEFSVENRLGQQEVEKEKLDVSYSFSNSYSEFSGDHRALSGRGGASFSGVWYPFPSNYEMLTDMNANLVDRLKSYIEKYDWWYE